MSRSSTGIPKPGPLSDLSDDHASEVPYLVPTLEDVGMLHICARPNIEFGVDESQDALNWAMRMSAGRRRPLLFNLAGARVVSPRVVNHLVKRIQPSDFVALALVLDSTWVWTLSTLVMQVRRPTIPMRSYTSVVEAMAWLSGHRDFT